ncbi:MAG: CRISPR-associated helicase Cas3', partial [Solirubrobacteraceae bacterium]
GLLAPFAVGTIDQALLAVMWVRHGTVRLWGLQGKVVVFDEIHSYDPYSAALLTRLVEWLAALDCTVVLLSATLPVDRRRRLTDAFRSGLRRPATTPVRAATASRRRKRGAGPLPASEAALASYPRVTIADASGVAQRSVADDRPARIVQIRELAVPAEDADRRVARRLLDAVEDGGCVGVVCNTVASAQARFAALRTDASADVELRLLHARQRPVERDAIERRVLTRLGPPSDPRVDRPRRMIVVATQIIEQSLDIDFDLLLSDLAPIDLLVQRAGRVHRHQRAGRPGPYATACLELVDVEGDPAHREFLVASDRVYARSVLQRTRLALRGRATVTEPDDLDALIATVYDEERPRQATPAEDVALAAADAQDRDKAREQLDAADGVRGALLPAPRSGTEPWNDQERVLPEPDDPRRFGDVRQDRGRYGTVVTTRWQERPSVPIVVLRADELPSVRYRPDRIATRELLTRSVSLSQPAVVAPVLRDWQRVKAARRLRPASWAANAALRHHALVELDVDGRARPVETPDGTVRVPLRLDPDLGVIVETGR